MTTYQFTVVIEPDEEGFHAYVPALPGCHTFGDTIDEARVNIEEAMQLHLEGMLEDGETLSSESFQTMLASEAILRREGGRPEEDKAWADL